MELVTLLLIPELVSQSLVREDSSLTHAIIAVCTLLSLVFLNSLLMQKSGRVADMVEGKPALLAQHGKFIVNNMNKERISPKELFAEMHQVGLYQLSQIKWAVLESDGRIAFVPEEEKRDREKQGSPLRPVEQEIQ